MARFNVPIRTGLITAHRPKGILAHSIVAVELLAAVTRWPWRRPARPFAHVGSVWVPRHSMAWEVRGRRVSVIGGVPYSIDARANGLWPQPLEVVVAAGASIVLIELPHRRPPNIEERAAAHFRATIGTPYDFPGLGALALLCPLNWRPSRLRRHHAAICSAAVSYAHQALYGQDPIPWAAHRFTIPSDFLNARTGRSIRTRELSLTT